MQAAFTDQRVLAEQARYLELQVGLGETAVQPLVAVQKRNRFRDVGPQPLKPAIFHQRVQPGARQLPARRRPASQFFQGSLIAAPGGIIERPAQLVNQRLGVATDNEFKPLACELIDQIGRRLGQTYRVDRQRMNLHESRHGRLNFPGEQIAAPPVGKNPLHMGGGLGALDPGLPVHRIAKPVRRSRHIEPKFLRKAATQGTKAQQIRLRQRRQQGL